MALQYTTVAESSFARGIDARSAENQIVAGFVRDLVNADIIEGRIRKRTGYASYGGNIPLRVINFKQTNSTNELCLSFDNSIDLSVVPTCPILVYGKSSNVAPGTGPFTTAGDTIKYYTNWTTTLRKTLAAQTAGTVTALADEHNIATTDMFVGLAESIDDKKLSANDLLWGDDSGSPTSISLNVNKSNYNITAGYTNGSDTAVKAFLYYKDRSLILTETYAQTWTAAAGYFTQVITSATHQLANYNITYQLWRDDGTVWTKVKPNEFIVDSASGDVVISGVNDTGSSVTYRVILSTVPAENSNDYNITTGTNIIAIDGVTSPFLFYTLYVVTGTTLTEVIPDEYQYDDDAKRWTVTFKNNTAAALVARVYYDYGSVRVNQLCITDASITQDGIDNSPQLTVYGLSHSAIYGENKNVNRRGWVTHLDSYRSPNTTHVVAGLGGNLFAALPANEAPSVFATTMNVYYPKLNARLDTAFSIGPVFWDVGSAPALNRGSITHTAGGTNWATVTAIAYQSGTTTRYTLSVPGKVVTGTPVSTDDYLTVKGMSHSKHNGVFKIVAYNLSASPDTITIDVTNSNITNSDYDDSASAGLGGIFTDKLTFSTASPFKANDTLLSSFWGDETELVVVSISGFTSTISQVYNYLQLGAGLVITGRRTSAEIPLRNLLNQSTTTNLVPGDTLAYSEFGRPLQVVSVDYLNYTATLDEAITWEDNLSAPPSFTVTHRWIPAESPVPDSGDNLLPTTTVRHLSANDFDDQPFLRSAMVQNNMYFTNGDDEVYKYDGSSFYRAGIIPWQPGLFMTTQAGVANGIKLSGISASASAIGGTLVISKADATQFPVGTVIKYSDSLNTAGITLTVSSNTEKSASDHSLTFEEPLAIVTGGTSGAISFVYQARYSFRLNIKDKNGVVTASAVTGAEDFVVNVAPTATTQYTINLRLAGLPAWDQYDYSNKNIELKIYRTLWTTKALGEIPVFFEIGTKQMPYTGTDGYIDFTDKLGNDTLVDGDPVAGVLSPEIVPAGWDEPARAKYVTSAGNRLVLGNVTDWPTLAISYLTSGAVSYTDYNGQKFLFRRDSTDSATATNMVDRVTYELKSNGGVVTSSWNTVAGTSFTFTCLPPRSLVAGDWVYLYYGTTTVGDLAYSGWWQISTSTVNSTTTTGTGTTVTTVNVADATAFPTAGVVKIGSTAYTYTGKTPTSLTGLSPSVTYTAGQTVTNTTISVPTTLATTAPTTVPYAMFSTAAYDVPVNVDGDYNMGMVNGDTVSFLTPANRILRRIGMAINATMRMTNKALNNQTAFVPWLTARSEADTSGQLIVKQPRAEVKVPSVLISGGSGTYKTYINGSQNKGTAVVALTTRYPSRLLVSYNNYPEIFDNPWTVDTDGSASAIDVNSSDGQEITGVIPFFGESAFGAALQSGVLVVFKQNSIYLIDLSEKALGKNAVQRIETQGLGCTAPYSIAPTKDGIAFANDSGIYRLRRDQRIEYLGRFMERNWKEKVDRTYLDLAQGHHYGVGRQYKLSVPLIADSTANYAENSEVYVYNHTNETGDEPGGWARYTNHPATGWANLFQDAFYSTVNGSVKRVRSLGEDSDYRDDANEIEVILETRAIAFDQPGIRKVVSHVVVNYRTGGTSEDTKVFTAPDLYTEFDATTSFKLVSQNDPNGLSTVAGQDILTIRHSLPRRRCVYITVKITNNGKDQSLEIAGMTFVVAGLNSKGITQAATTKGQSSV